MTVNKEQRLSNGQSNGKIKIQKVKNYEADDIKNETPSRTSNVKKNNASQNNQSERRMLEGKNNNSSINIKEKVTSPTAWTKMLICLAYVFGISIILFLLQSWWVMLGLVGLAVPTMMYILAKDKTLKMESGKVLFVSVCTTILSMLFWVIYVSTRGYGIGFVSGLFRGLQITAAVLGALLVAYFFVEFATDGKVKIPFISRLTEKTQSKFSSFRRKEA